MILIVILAAIAYGYILLQKPEYAAILLFTITIANVNFDVAGMSFRALVGASVLARTFLPDGRQKGPPILTSGATMIFAFLAYATLVTMSYGLATPQFIKVTGQVAIAAICGYHFFMRDGNYRCLMVSLVLAGLICLGDLVYTYTVYGSFPVQRIYEGLLHIAPEVDENGEYQEVQNHNFYGLICAMCFVFLLHEFIYTKKTQKLLVFVLPLMFLGVLMSTSRSSLLGLIGISIFLLHNLIRQGNNAQKAIRFIMVAASAIVLSFMLFSFLQDALNLKSDFIDRISERLIEEPLAVMNKHLGLNYNAQSLDAMEWRGEASSDAWEAFLRLHPMEQIFGIGYSGYLARNLGHTNLNPHNAFLLILFENGIAGFLFYFIMVFGAIYTSIRLLPVRSPIVTLLIFILIYCIGQNGELTTSITFLFIVTLMAQIRLAKARQSDPGAYQLASP